MTTSRVPAAIDALLTLCRASAGLAGVEVVDGPPVVNLSNPDRLHIGWKPGEDLAVSLSQDFAGAGARRRDEQFQIQGYAETRSGEIDMQARRARVFEILAAVEDVLRATDANPTAPTLNGAVQFADLVTGDLRQYQTEGSAAGVEFVIACRARL